MSDTKTTPKAEIFDPRTFVVTDVRPAIWIMVDESQIAAWLGGERLPRRERKMKRCVTGDQVKRLAKVHAAELLRTGWIKVDDPKPEPEPEPPVVRVDARPTGKPDTKPAAKDGDE